MRSVVRRAAALTAVVALVVPGVAHAQTPEQFDYHRGRVYLFSLRPAWPLTPEGNASPKFEYSADSDNMYTDRAGVPWRLLSPCQSAYHQTSGAVVSAVACKTGFLADNKKFTATDSTGGSFEAILMPDGATATTPASGSPTYDGGNWLTTGPKIGTYNYVDPAPNCLSCAFAHYVLDVHPHDDDGYAPAPGEVWLDPTDPLLDWRTYRKRYADQVAPILKGAIQIARGDDSRVYRITRTNPDGTLVLGAPLDTDLTGVALRAATAAGQRPPFVTAATAGGTVTNLGSSPASGVWRGSYQCRQGETGLELVVSGSDPAALTASFQFYATAANPGVRSGRYLMTGTLSGTTLTLLQDRWVDQPPGFVMVDISATIDGNHMTGTVQGPSCGNVTLDRR